MCEWYRSRIVSKNEDEEMMLEFIIQNFNRLVSFVQFQVNWAVELTEDDLSDWENVKKIVPQILVIL